MIIEKNMIIAILICLCLTLTSFAAEQNSNDGQGRSFALPQHGKLVLKIPNSWKQVVRQPREDIPPTITLYPGKGDEFKVLITPLWSPKKDSTFNKPKKVRRLIDSDLRGMLSGAVEQQIVIQQFNGTNGPGYYFQVTDKAPKPGDYPYAVRAGVGVGDLLLSVTVLSRLKNSEGITKSIKMLQEAQQVY